jgi:hypothetical protein
MEDRQTQNFDADFGTERTPEPTEVEVKSPDSTPQPAEVSVGPETRGSRIKGIMKWAAAAAIGAAAVLGGQKLEDKAIENTAAAKAVPAPEHKTLEGKLFTPQISMDKKSYKINVPPIPMKLQIFPLGEVDPIEILTNGKSEISGNFKKETTAFFFKAYNLDGTEIEIIGNNRVVTEPQNDEEIPDFIDVDEAKKKRFLEGERDDEIYL